MQYLELINVQPVVVSEQVALVGVGTFWMVWHSSGCSCSIVRSQPKKKRPVEAGRFFVIDKV